MPYVKRMLFNANRMRLMNASQTCPPNVSFFEVFGGGKLAPQNSGVFHHQLMPKQCLAGGVRRRREAGCYLLPGTAWSLSLSGRRRLRGSVRTISACVALGSLKTSGVRLMESLPGHGKATGEERAPSCPNCGKLTSVTKRPEPDYNRRYLSYEREVFTCPACGQQTERILDL